MAPALSIQLQEHVLEVGFSTLSLPIAAGMEPAEFNSECVRSISNLVFCVDYTRGGENAGTAESLYVFIR